MNTRKQTLVSLLASRVNAVSNCVANGNAQWENTHSAEADKLVADFMPSGSGIDCGTTLDWDRSLRHAGEKLVFTLSFHHMNENGMYDGWTQHTLTVSPSLFMGPRLAFSGPNRNEIKDYLQEVYSHALTREIAWDMPENGTEFAGYRSA